MYNKRNNTPFASRKELVTSIFLACLNIALFGLISEFTAINEAILSFGIVLI